MADGDAVVRDIVACTYVSDDGTFYGNKTPSFYQAQNQLGWALHGASKYIPIPRGLKKRAWLVWNAADHTQRARIPVGTNGAYVAGEIFTTTVKVAYRGYELTMTLYGMEGERTRGITTDEGVQASIPV
jgi:hypothetical protein